MAHIICDAKDCGAVIVTQRDNYIMLATRTGIHGTGEQVDTEFYFDDRDCLDAWLRRNRNLQEVTT